MQIRRSDEVNPVLDPAVCRDPREKTHVSKYRGEECFPWVR